MSPNYKERKVCKKQRRCEAIVSGECDIESSEDATPFLAVLNAGLSTGLTEEDVLDTATPHGVVMQLVMLPNKSYCFLECASVLDAEQIFKAMHNSAKIGQNGAVVYLQFFKQMPLAASENVWQKALPAGLVVLPNFVSPSEEQALLGAIYAHSVSEDANSCTLKHRRVQHYGYEFMYGTNNVDSSRPLEQNIPGACELLWPRLELVTAREGISLGWQTPDQLTVNEYEPGQGIPPHVDTHSAFLDPILSLSLLGDVVMDFRRGAERIPILLPHRSLLIMAGEARYDWTHGITPRVLDVVPTATGVLTTKQRTKRTSFTFRRLRRAPCDCAFPTLCDTRLNAEPETPLPMKQLEALRLEERNVHSVYDQIATHFSETRHTPWPQVSSFLHSFESGSVLLDVGCGNGKYIDCNPDILTIGCDRSQGLLGVCATKRQSVFKCDCMQVPFRGHSVDGCISIAVIHHLATFERRLAAVREMARLLRKGGRALIYVWAKNQRSKATKSSYLLQNKAINKHKTTEEQQRQITAQQFDKSSALLPIHTNRTEFLQQDMLVPWKLKTSHASAVQPTTFLRYYHVFAAQELDQVVAQVPEVELLRSYYDQGNYCVIFRKK